MKKLCAFLLVLLAVVAAYENNQVWAVQFHPESLVQEDDKWLPLFEAFLNRIKE